MPDLADPQSASIAAEMAQSPALISVPKDALANLEEALFNLWLAANNIGARIEHGVDDPQPLGRALRQEAGFALQTLFEWRRLRWGVG